MHPQKINGKWEGHWKSLTPMPRGVSAAGNPLPVLHDGRILFWGGVDANIALHKDPSTHPGIPGEIYWYTPMLDSWAFAGTEKEIKARVTLPVVQWNDQWLYISGEIRPAVRTNTVIGIDDRK